MVTCQYCTPEWLEQGKKSFDANPNLRESLKTLSKKMCYKIKADPAWGIDQDIIFGAFFEKGQLTKLAFFSEDAARAEADFILAATPQEWKKLLRKENKFAIDFMKGHVKLEKGTLAGVLTIAPHADRIVNAITQVPLQFPDEMSPEELSAYRTYMNSFRESLGV